MRTNVERRATGAGMGVTISGLLGRRRRLRGRGTDEAVQRAHIHRANRILPEWQYGVDGDDVAVAEVGRALPPQAGSSGQWPALWPRPLA